MTNRKLKKRLQKEADMLLQAKKEEMLAFYQPAGEKQTRGRRFPVRALVAGGLVALLLAAVVVAASFGSRPMVKSDASDLPSMPELPSLAGSEPAVTSKPSTISGTDSGSKNADIRPGIYGLDDSYAIVEILEGTEETLGQYRYGTWYDYTKIKCRVLYSYRSEIFLKTKDDGWKADQYVPFDELQEIYVLSDFADDLKPNDVIFFCVEELELYGKFAADRHLCYGPDSGYEKTEYLPFVDGKLVFPEGAFSMGSFSSLDYVNLEIELILEHDGEGVHPVLYEACPKYLFEEGLDIEQVIDFFDKCKVFREAYAQYAEKQPDFCVIYVPEG